MAQKKPVLDLSCPKCHHGINFLDQMRDWMEMACDEDGSPPPPVWINLWCPTCADMTTSMFWEENDDEEHIEVPGLRDLTSGIDDVVINFPKSMRGEP